MVNRFGDPRLSPASPSYRDLQKVYTLNKYNLQILIYYKETMKILVTNIN